MTFKRFGHHHRVFGLVALISSLYSTTAISADATSSFDESRFAAVDGLNAKLDLGYLSFDSNLAIGDIEGGVAIGSISLPVGERFGLQVDVGLGRFNGNSTVGDIDSFGVGGHFFTRDPDVGLLGVYGDYVELDIGAVEVESMQLGVEAEVYLGQVSFEAFAGANTVEVGATERTFASLDFTTAYYVNDDFRIEGGVSREFNETLGNIGFEAMLPSPDNNFSVYANASFGDDQESVQAGIRLYFGQSTKSLKDRHRQDDPKERVFNFNGLDLQEFLPATRMPMMCGEGTGYSCT